VKKTKGQKSRENVPLTRDAGAQIGLFDEKKTRSRKSCDRDILTFMKNLEANKQEQCHF
jgi:hypothetical protein